MAKEQVFALRMEGLGKLHIFLFFLVTLLFGTSLLSWIFCLQWLHQYYHDSILSQSITIVDFKICIRLLHWPTGQTYFSDFKALVHPGRKVHVSYIHLCNGDISKGSYSQHRYFHWCKPGLWVIFILLFFVSLKIWINFLQLIS